MASYAPNFTGRLKLSYTTLGANYTQTWRYGAAGSAAGLLAELANVYTALPPLLSSDFQFTGAESSNAGEDFFLPLPLGALASFTGTSIEPPSNLAEFRASALQFVGKTTTGNPWRVNIFGALVAPFNTEGASASDDFRISASDSPVVNSVISDLASAVSAESLCGNDGNPVIFRSYANIIISSYRIRRIRRFG